MLGPKGPYLCLEGGDARATIDVLNGMGVTVIVEPDFAKRTVRVVLRTSHGEGSSSWSEQETTVEALPVRGA